MALNQILYLSSLVTDSREIIRQILEVAARRNAQRNITGVMLYAEGNVLQVLEGEREVLAQTFRSIEADPRHHGIIVLIEKEIPAREFAGWHLGFKHLSAMDMASFPLTSTEFKRHNQVTPSATQVSDAMALMQTFAEDYRSSPDQLAVRHEAA
jgi:hypothetical protein